MWEGGRERGTACLYPLFCFHCAACDLTVLRMCDHSQEPCALLHSLLPHTRRSISHALRKTTSSTRSQELRALLHSLLPPDTVKHLRERYWESGYDDEATQYVSQGAVHDMCALVLRVRVCVCVCVVVCRGGLGRARVCVCVCVVVCAWLCV